MTLYRVMVLSGDKAEVEIEAESAAMARDLAQAQWEFEPEDFEENNFVEADTWWSVEEVHSTGTTGTERAGSAAPTGVL